MKIDLKNGKRREKSWIVRTLNRQLWPDSVTDALTCYAYALFALLLGSGALFLGGSAIAGGIAIVLSFLFVIAGVGLGRERHWAALLATALTGMTGSWFASLAFAARARELKEQELTAPPLPPQLQKALPRGREEE